jgi:orotate phosphoribosyltransferase
VGSRIFDVYSDGTTLLKGFDILKEAGGIANRAVIRVFRHVPASPQGKIDLTFVPVVNYALINAIEVVEE